MMGSKKEIKTAVIIIDTLNLAGANRKEAISILEEVINQLKK